MKVSIRLLGGTFVPASKEDAEKINNLTKNCIYEVDIKEKKRSSQQNRLIHQFCKNIENEATKQNFKLKDLVKDGTPITMILVKELIFKKVCMSLYGKDSTTKLNTNELNLVFDSIILALASYGLDTSNILKE